LPNHKKPGRKHGRAFCCAAPLDPGRHLWFVRITAALPRTGPGRSAAPQGSTVRNESALPYIWMLCGSLPFSVMGALGHALGHAGDWQVVAFVRCAIPFLLVAALARSAGVRLVLWKPATLWLRSIAGSLSLIGTFYALAHLPISDVFT